METKERLKVEMEETVHDFKMETETKMGSIRETEGKTTSLRWRTKQETASKGIRVTEGRLAQKQLIKINDRSKYKTLLFFQSRGNRG